MFFLKKTKHWKTKDQKFNNLFALPKYGKPALFSEWPHSWTSPCVFLIVENQCCHLFSCIELHFHWAVIRITSLKQSYEFYKVWFFFPFYGRGKWGIMVSSLCKFYTVCSNLDNIGYLCFLFHSNSGQQQSWFPSRKPAAFEKWHRRERGCWCQGTSCCWAGHAEWALGCRCPESGFLCITR